MLAQNEYTHGEIIRWYAKASKSHPITKLTDHSHMVQSHPSIK